MNWNISLCLLWDVCVFPVDFMSLINHWQISNTFDFPMHPDARTMLNTKSKRMWFSVATKNLSPEVESLSLISYFGTFGCFGTGSLFCMLFHSILAAYTAIQAKCKLWMTSAKTEKWAYSKPVDDASFLETLTVHLDAFWMSSCEWGPATNHSSHQHHDSQPFRRIIDRKRKGRDIAAADQFSHWYHRMMFKVVCFIHCGKR